MPRDRDQRRRGRRAAALGLSAVAGAAVIGMTPKPALASGPAWTWTIAASPNPTPEQTSFYQNELLGVTCPAPSDCWAVGDSGLVSASISPVIEHSDGGSWQTVASPAVNGDLASVTCLSASDCWAVGREDVPGAAGDTYLTLIEHYDGASWTIVKNSPNVSNATYNSLNSIACVASGCTAAGSYMYGVFNPFGYSVTVQQTLIEHYDAASNLWSIVSSPNTSASLNNGLSGVSCPSATDCWAVGVAVAPNRNSQTLIEHWDGTAWTIVSSPSPSSVNNSLSKVSCPSETECWAAGDYGGSTATQALVEHYDGTSMAWTVSDAADTSPRQQNSLTDIACAAVTQCAAAGNYGDNISRALAEAFDGDSWTIAITQDTPGNPGAGGQVGDYLNGVTCASSVECWAVGSTFDYHTPNGGYQTLIEHGLAAPAPGPNVPEAPLAALLLVPGMAGLAVGAAVQSRRRDRCARL